MMKVSGLLPRALTLCALWGRGAVSVLSQRRRRSYHPSSSLHFVLPHIPPPSTRPLSMLRIKLSCLSSNSITADPYSTTRQFSSPPPHLSAPPPPPLLDKSLFNETRHLQALRLPAMHCHKAIQSLAPYLFRTTGQRSVVLPGECKLDLSPPLRPDERLLLFSLLSTEHHDIDENSRCTITTTKQQLEKGKHKLTDLLQSLPSASLLPSPGYPVQLTYADLSLHQALRRLLPPSLAVPSSFETVGHLAHLNLRPEALPYKHEIAQVIIDKNPKRIKTVVNKVGEIENTFRVLPLEVIGGEAGREGGKEGGTFVKVKESGAWFAFDFREVYWNSRLQGEHARMIDVACGGRREEGQQRDGKSAMGVTMGKKRIQKREMEKEQPQVEEEEEEEEEEQQRETAVVWDVFAGVGPFSIPLAMRGCCVYANDLNDRSYHYLCRNARQNKVLLPPSLSPASSSPSPTSSSLDSSSLDSSSLDSSSSSSMTATTTPAAPATSAAPTAGLLYPSNQDGRMFLRDLASKKTPVSHVIMNLPAIAYEFLDVFAEEEEEEVGAEGGREGCLGRVAESSSTFGEGKEGEREGGRKKEQLFGYLKGKGVMVHVYLFTKAADAEGDVIERAASVMGVKVETLKGGREGGRVSVHHVRDVAPKKRMMCLSFPLDVVLGS